MNFFKKKTISFPNDSWKKNFEELVRASSLLSNDLSFSKRISVLVEQTLDITGSDLAALYLRSDTTTEKSGYNLEYKRGRYILPEKISSSSQIVEFIEECEESVVLLERKPGPFEEVLLHESMNSGIALPLSGPEMLIGIVFLNSKQPLFYTSDRFTFLDSFTELAGSMIRNSRLYKELSDSMKQIENLERYQKNIFDSMTNLLITTDKNARIRYYNRSAEEGFSLEESLIDKSFYDVFEKKITSRILQSIKKADRENNETPGMEGIYKSEDKEMDFSLNVSPLRGKRGAKEGITLIFTDQTRERELTEKMEQVVEERRVIKNMFSRYLSTEIVNQLVDHPELIKLGGDKKEATIFFADIRGYTSFSEGQEPEYIVEVLNEYFTEAVDIVIKHRGYIDKFIGDCIMAAWGVPIQTVKEDAISAVSCALEIQKLVSSNDRKFFKGEASKLTVGIGMHTGQLVAGNLGGVQRKDYTVIGDTVNVASRLEGIAKAGDVIITQHTRNYLDDLFTVKPLSPVSVKGKKEPIPVYRVIERIK